MRSEAFFSSCQTLHSLLDAADDGLPDLSILEAAEGLAVFGVSPNDSRSDAHRLVDAVATTLRTGCHLGVGLKSCVRLFRHARDVLLRHKCFLAAQELELNWSGIRASRGPVRRRSVHAVQRDPVVDAPSRSAARPLSFPATESQRRCAQKLLELASLFFEPPPEAVHGIPVQTNSLVLGPTGCGKTTVVRRVAAQLGAELMHLTHGSWIVAGAADAQPTIDTIVHRAAHTERLVVFIDELDKFGFEAPPVGGWELSVRADLWMLLDRALSWASLANDRALRAVLPEESRSALTLERLFAERVFIVAAGTWQDLYAAQATVGFGRTDDVAAVNATELCRSGRLPEEVLRRFNAEILSVDYPSVAELGALMEQDGLLRLGEVVGTPVDPRREHARISQLGMSVLPSLKTSLLLMQRTMVAAKVASGPCMERVPPAAMPTGALTDNVTSKKGRTT